MWLEHCWHSLEIYVVLSSNTGTDIPPIGIIFFQGITPFTIVQILTSSTLRK
jgi:hypothetical protein